MLKLRLFFPINGWKKKGFKILKDRKINSVDKFNKLVLVNGDNEIIWVVGMRLIEGFQFLVVKKIIDIKIDND